MNLNIFVSCRTLMYHIYICVSWILIVILHYRGLKNHTQISSYSQRRIIHIIFTIQHVLLKWNTANNNNNYSGLWGWSIYPSLPHQTPSYGPDIRATGPKEGDYSAMPAWRKLKVNLCTLPFPQASRAKKSSSFLTYYLFNQHLLKH